MISRHHSPLVQPSNSGRASTWSIFAESAADSLSQMGTDVSSDRPGRAMRSNYPQRASTTGNADHGPPGSRRSGTVGHTSIMLQDADGRRSTPAPDRNPSRNARTKYHSRHRMPILGNDKNVAFMSLQQHGCDIHVVGRASKEEPSVGDIAPRGGRHRVVSGNSCLH